MEKAGGGEAGERGLVEAGLVCFWGNEQILNTY